MMGLYGPAFYLVEPQIVSLQESTYNYKYFKRHLIYCTSAKGVQRPAGFTDLSERQREARGSSKKDKLPRKLLDKAGRHLLGLCVILVIL